MRMIFQRIFGGFRGLLLIFIVGAGLFLHLYTQKIINQLREEARSLVLFYAQMYAKVADAESSEDITFLFDQIIRKTNFPLIQTDSENRPVGWKGLPYEPSDMSERTLHRIEQIVKKLERQIEPVPIKYKDTLLGYLYYGDSRLVLQLQWLPYVEIGVIGLFIALGFVGYASIKRSEQRSIWVGMAKETAHQLGTPISSLMGWLEVIRSKGVAHSEEVVREMEKDVSRLQKVTRRFSLIGSKPDLKKTVISYVLKETVEYMRARVPTMGRRVIINCSFDDVPPLAINKDIFQWAVENILKNSLEAMDKDEGRIWVRLGSERKGRVFIEVQDNGKGIDPSIRKKVFKPGISTKKRGWGLGLSLVKRIIEDYHGGHIFIKETRLGWGTVVRIELKC